MRAISFASLRRSVIAREDTRRHASIFTSFASLGAPSRANQRLRVLDLGAGCGWLSNRLAGWGTIPARSI